MVNKSKNIHVIHRIVLKKNECGKKRLDIVKLPTKYAFNYFPK